MGSLGTLVQQSFDLRVHIHTALRLGGKGRQPPWAQSPRVQSLRAWPSSEPRETEEKPREAAGPPGTLSSIEDSRLVSWLSLVTMLIALASPGTWEMRERAIQGTFAKSGGLECFPCLIASHPPNNTQVLSLLPLPMKKSRMLSIALNVSWLKFKSFFLPFSSL